MGDGISRCDQQSIKEVSVVVLVVNHAMIGGAVSSTECRIAVHMVRVPVPQVLNIRMLFFDAPEYALLVVAVLKKSSGSASGTRSRLNDAGDDERETAGAVIRSIRSDESSASL